ncbi:small multi-drug export protein [Domibacillus robiginosus]|uniref:small multi-drug export protein n=1 Tax=Domibacillus robiginosus TaxID=1071054 RepID=UPI00067AEB1A|nr:small multi-drug export protein [Domibacillus robiginosus]
MLEWAEQADFIWQLVVLFLLGAAPWMDVSIIIPIGILWGLPPVAVALTAFIGNFLLLLLLGIFFEQINIWRLERKKKKGLIGPSKKETRSKVIWDKYGIPGLAIIAPIFVGTDIAAIFALIFGSSRKRVIGWMTGSLAFWTLIFTICSIYGFNLLDLK